MPTFTIKSPARCRVIIRGGPDVARVAVATYLDFHRPIRDVSVNGYGNVHATVWADQDQLTAWWDAVPRDQPGALLFYNY